MINESISEENFSKVIPLQLVAKECATLLWLKPYEIDYSRYRCRIGINPKYNALYNSLQNMGFMGEQFVTRAPGEILYTLYAGGATRIEIIDLLTQEGNNAKTPIKVPCRFIPWPGKNSVLLSNMIQDQTQGVSVYEQSRVLKQIGIAYNAWKDVNHLPRLKHALKKIGYRATEENLKRCWLMIEVLDGLIPENEILLLNDSDIDWFDKLLTILNTQFNSSEHVHSYNIFRATALKWRSVDLDDLKKTILLRYVSDISQQVNVKISSIRWDIAEAGL